MHFYGAGREKDIFVWLKIDILNIKIIFTANYWALTVVYKTTKKPPYKHGPNI
jgi:hypothetical protein